MIKLEILILFLAIVQLSIYSQEFSTTIYFEDAVGNRDSIIVGYDANATDGLDAIFNEVNLIESKVDSGLHVFSSDVFIAENAGEIIRPSFRTKKQIINKNRPYYVENINFRTPDFSQN